MIKVAYRRKNGSKSLLKLNFIIIANGNRDGCTPLNDCAMIRGYRDSTKALIECMNNRGRAMQPIKQLTEAISDDFNIAMQPIN